MFIKTEETPNPDTFKFIPIAGDGDAEIQICSNPIEFSNIDDTSGISDFASKLFEINGVKSVFFSPKYISITRIKGIDFLSLRAEIITTFMDFLLSGNPFMTNKEEIDNTNDFREKFQHLSEEEQEVVLQIKEIIDDRIRPAVEMDGGDITFVDFDFDSGIVYVKLKGACSGCPSAQLTLKGSIEQMLRFYISNVQSVEAIEE